MPLRINTVVCSLIVLLTIGQIATAGPTIPAAQNEMMEAMKSGDSARIQKAANALAAQRGMPGSAGKQNAHGNSGMPTLSVADQKLMASPQGKQILANHVKLRKTNPSEASDIETKASISKATRDWHKQNPNEKREPSQTEIYKPIMMIAAISDLRDLAIVGYEPERLRIANAKAQALAIEQAKSKTPNFDKLSPDEKLAVEWSVSAAYREAHVNVNVDTLARIHGVNGKNLLNEVRHSSDAFNASPQASRKIIGVKGDTGGGFFGRGTRTLYENSPEYIGEDAIIAKRKELARAVVSRLPDNPEALQKWRQLQCEAIATGPEHVASVLSNFKLGQPNERDVKEKNAGVVWPAYTDDWHTIIANDFATRNGTMIRENIDTVIKRATVEMSGCEWTKGLYSVEKNPSTLCDFNGNTLPLTPLTTPVSSTSKSK